MNEIVMPKIGEQVHFRGRFRTVKSVMGNYVKMNNTGGCWYTFCQAEGFKEVALDERA